MQRWAVLPMNGAAVIQELKHAILLENMNRVPKMDEILKQE